MEKATAVKVIGPYSIEVVFTDGSHREIDLEQELWGEVFAPLCDPVLFAQAAVDTEGGSVYWPTGADLSPEFLYYGDEGPPPDFYDRGNVVDDAREALSEVG